VLLGTYNIFYTLSSALYYEVIQRSGDAITYVLRIHSLGGNTIVLSLQYATSCSRIFFYLVSRKTQDTQLDSKRCQMLTDFQKFPPPTPPTILILLLIPGFPTANAKVITAVSLSSTLVNIRRPFDCLSKVINVTHGDALTRQLQSR